MITELVRRDTRRIDFHLQAASSRDDGSGEGAALPVRVLIVEDDYLAGIEAEAAVTGAGFTVVGVAASASEARLLARTARPSLVVMDIRLLGPIDGVDLAVDLLRLHGIRSLFASAHSDPATRRRAAAAAPLGWLPKPYTGAALVAMIASVLPELGKKH